MNDQSMPNLTRFLFLSLGCAVLCAWTESAPGATGEFDSRAVRVEKQYRHGPWCIVETASFQACCRDFDSARQLVQRAEQLRGELQAKWLGRSEFEIWSPRCQIVVHPNRQAYVAAAGRGSQRTVGSSLVTTDEKRIVGRRIDLLGNRGDVLTAALPHELTHIVLRDRFPTTPLPRWADEGTAMLADPASKQRRHFGDLEEALTDRTVFHAATLLTLDEYPPPNRVGVFYGQSASLTEFLVKRKSPAQFVDFIDRAMTKGYDVALRECYAIANVGELDRQWRREAYAVDSSPADAEGGLLVSR